MFCGCPVAFGSEPNANVCPVCLGLPGALPRTNAVAIEFALRLGAALGCGIAEDSVFALNELALGLHTSGAGMKAKGNDFRDNADLLRVDGVPLLGQDHARGL